MAEWLKSSCV